MFKMWEILFVEIKYNINNKNNIYKILMIVLVVKCYNLEFIISVLVKNMWKCFLEVMEVFDIFG